MKKASEDAVFVSPLGIEPRAKEPESFILSIKLRALFRTAKVVRFWKFRTFAASKSKSINIIYWILIV